MPLGQFTAGVSLVAGQTTFDNFAPFNRGMKAGTAFGAPTITVGAGAGAGTLGTVKGSDFAGNFQLQVATSGNNAGTFATVTFGTPLGAVPNSVVVNMSDNATSNGALVASANNVTVNGFSVISGSAASTHTYTVNYLVIQ